MFVFWQFHKSMFHPAVSLQYIASTWRDNKKEKNNQTDAEKKAFHPEGSGVGLRWNYGS